MARNRFFNPANSTTYEWPTNHQPDGEDEFGKTRNITRSAPTGNVGLVKQQGDDGPLVMTLRGSILTRAFYQQMWIWYDLCRTQTIYFYDFDDQQYEVQITSFRPQRVGATRQGRNPDTHYWKYTLVMEVYRVISGDLAGVDP